MIKMSTFDCPFCDHVEGYSSDDERHEAAMDHMVEQHESEVREQYNQRERDKEASKQFRSDMCQRGCGAYIEEDLFCSNGHDNLNWWLGYKFGMGGFVLAED